MRRSATAAEPPAPVSEAEFAASLAAFAPFEASPGLAVAVSGGADSLALTLLADRWARERGGSVVGLTVDHKLRDASAAEVRQVAAWLAARGIAHRTLVWEGPRPEGDIQAAARAARHRLLAGWCRAHGVLHLLTAHHRGDQAETLLMRLGRGSGLAGLSGMAACVEHADHRVLRPLLAVPRERLRKTLEDAGQAWIEDPSNDDPRFARVRVRQARPALAALDLSEERLAGASFHAGRARAALEAQAEAVLAASVTLDPAGIAFIDPAPLLAAPAEIRLRGMAAVLVTVGGAEYPPRFERLVRLESVLSGGRLGGGVTLLGCRMAPWRDRWLVYREAAAAAPPLDLEPGQAARWDGRFAAVARDDADGLSIGAFGLASELDRRAIAADAAAPHLPRRIRASLPALWQGGTVVGVPHLGWWRAGCESIARVRFRPNQALCGAGFVAGRNEGRRR